jgi:hypothetical protein
MEYVTSETPATAPESLISFVLPARIDKRTCGELVYERQRLI